MKEELETTGGSSFVPFILGGLIGGGLALLFAPKAGRELRQDIKEFAADAAEKASSTIDKGRDLIEEGKTILSSAIEAGKAAYAREKEQHLKAA